MLDEKLDAILDDVLRRNPGEVEFHQAVREVLDSLGPVVAKHPEFADQKIIQRSASRNARSSSACRGRTTRARCTSTAACASSSTARSDRTRGV
jgi:hypothetical protein